MSVKGDMSVEESGYRFLSGVEMQPDAVLAAYSEAQFIARARLATAAGEVWGIVIRLASPGSDSTADVRNVTTDDGRTIAAAVAGDGRPTGDPAAILAAAKYWELPPSYIKTLAPIG